MSRSGDLLAQIAQVLGGDEAVTVVKALQEMGEATDDQLAVKTGVRINNIRKILYRLYDHSLVSNKRLRDEKTGWFIFIWRPQPDQVAGFIRTQKKKILEKIKMRLDYEKQHDFYTCDTPEDGRLTFEQAMESVFRCPRCNKPLKHFDNQPFIRALEDRMKLLEKELSD
jgi:transcription initiation factor TFIIE subunit alpha